MLMVVFFFAGLQVELVAGGLCQKRSVFPTPPRLHMIASYDERLLAQYTAL